MADPYFYSRMRDALPASDSRHALVGPLEHREFAREATRDNPALAAPIAAGIPLWTLLKSMGLLKTRSPASVDEMFAGYEGMLSGLKDRIVGRPIGTVEKEVKHRALNGRRTYETQLMLLIQAAKKLYPNDQQAQIDYVYRQMYNMRDQSAEIKEQQPRHLFPRSPDGPVNL